MRVLHVIGGLSRESGGPSRSVQGLVAAECAAGIDAWLWPVGGGKPWVEGVRVVAKREMTVGDLQHYDIVHIHCLWEPRLHRIAVMCRKIGVPYVIAPRGMMEPWSLKQKWLKKKLARFFYQDDDLHCAVAIHATAESEARQLRKLGFKNLIVISPNGVNLPPSLSPLHPFALSLDAKRRVLFVSRMHPKKGVMELVEAWKRICLTGWVCELVYTRSGDLEQAYEAKVKARMKELGLEASLIFTGPLDDEEKWEAYRRADLFVLPTYSENFGIVVAEALWAGVPVITTKGTPWQDLEAEKCGWWIDLPDEGSNSSAWPALDGALRAAAALPREDLRAMGARGHGLVERKYVWEAVCKKMVEGYEKVKGGRLECVKG